MEAEVIKCAQAEDNKRNHLKQQHQLKEQQNKQFLANQIQSHRNLEIESKAEFLKEKE
jgi:hypothetical protein